MIMFKFLESKNKDVIKYNDICYWKQMIKKN